MREPDNSSKYKYKQVGRDLSFFFFYAGASTFSFLSLSSWAAWKTIFCALAFVEVPPQLRRKAQQTIPRLVPHLSHRFPFEKDGCQHSSSSPFLAGNHEYTFEDWRRERRRQRGWRRQGVCRESRPYFSFEFRFRIMFSYFFSFNPNDHCFHFLHTDMHSPLDSIPHIFGRMHAPVHRRTCFQHICTHTRSHAPSIPQQTFCCFFSPPANFGFRKKCWYRRVNERFRYESPRKPTLSAIMLLEKT